MTEPSPKDYMVRFMPFYAEEEPTCSLEIRNLATVFTLSSWIILGKHEKNPGFLPKKVKQVNRNMELYERDPVVSTKEKRNTKIYYSFLLALILWVLPPILNKLFF